MNKDTCFSHAKAMSKMSDFKKAQIGTVVVYKGKIISTGFNSTKTHPIQRKYNILRFKCDSTSHNLHSEVHALSSLMHMRDINWNRVKIFNYREHKSGEVAMSRPCKSCMQLIKNLGIRNIYYTTEDGYAHEVIEG